MTEVPIFSANYRTVGSLACRLMDALKESLFPRVETGPNQLTGRKTATHGPGRTIQAGKRQAMRNSGGLN